MVFADVEEAGAEVKEIEGEVEEEVEEERMSMGALGVRGLKIWTVSAASVLEEVDSSDEELPVDVGTGSPLDITMPHGSSPKTWPVQPQLERQESTQFAPPQSTFFSGCCGVES